MFLSDQYIFNLPQNKQHAHLLRISNNRLWYCHKLLAYHLSLKCVRIASHVLIQ